MENALWKICHPRNQLNVAFLSSHEIELWEDHITEVQNKFKDIDNFIATDYDTVILSEKDRIPDQRDELLRLNLSPREFVGMSFIPTKDVLPAQIPVYIQSASKETHI